MILNWFDTAEVDKFTDAVVEALIAGFPPSELEDQRRKSSARFKGATDALFASTAKFAATNPLNVYQKAHLGSRFKWALK